MRHEQSNVVHVMNGQERRTCTLRPQSHIQVLEGHCDVLPYMWPALRSDVVVGSNERECRRQEFGIN
jgi:hypothetical protein